MDKDLIIGAASNYDWDTIKYWVNSIKMSGFTGDIVVIGSNISEETVQRLVEQGVKVALHPHTQNAPHVERFFYLYEVLRQIGSQSLYRAVIVTDTRDVIFQTNPSEWLDDNFYENPTKELIISSEGMYYKDEPWGAQNIQQTFGPFFYEKMKDNLIYNVGVIAGTSDVVRDLMLMIFQMSINRPIPIVDQAVFNFLMSTVPWSDIATATDNADGWAIQLGTTEEAVKAGKGDLGAHGIEAYAAKYDDWQPYFHDNGFVFVDGLRRNEDINAPDDELRPFCIVHQWNRVPALAAKVKEIYG